MSTIKLPVRDGGDTSILDANGRQIAFAVFGEMKAIVNAINATCEPVAVDGETAEDSIRIYNEMLELLVAWEAETKNYSFNRSAVETLKLVLDATCQSADRERELVEALEQALMHLHWLTIGGEFAAEAFDGTKTWCFASAREFGAARDFGRDARKTLACYNGEPYTDSTDGGGK